MIALSGWAVGEVIWAVYDVRPEVEHATHPAAAEAVFLLYPIGAMASLVLLSHLSRQSPRRVVLDGLIVATSLFVVSWVFVLDKQLREDTGSRLSTLAQVFEDPRSVAIVRSTVALARSLRADLVAEGVEDEITLRALRRYGCTITQGFVHSPPLPANELQQWIICRAPGSDSKSEAGVSD